MTPEEEFAALATALKVNGSWVTVVAADKDQWLVLAREALTFVAASSRRA